jgi:uncharacterized protein (TIGR02001 family)
MNKTKLALASLLTIASASAFSQAAAPAAPAPTPEWTITGNAGLFSDYRFRGISQTDKKPAFQGGFDVAHSSGLYAGNWNSNVDSALYSGANIEMDFYAGYKGAVADTGVGYDIGAIYYYYPGSARNGAPGIDNKEIYVGASYGPVSAKVYVPIGDFFSAQRNFGGKSASGSFYVDLSGAYDLANVGAPGFGVVAHIGYQDLRGAAKLTPYNKTKAESSYIDWKLGATYTVASGPFNGFVVGLSYIDTDIEIVNGGGSSNRIISGATGVLSVSKSF